MRYFARLSYLGSEFYGWQKQVGQTTVQSCIEDCFSLILREQIEVTGCGRTDTGVHASEYYLHFDALHDPQPHLARINKFLPSSIAIHQIFPVHESAHARYDASSRTYIYVIDYQKNPFRRGLTWYFPKAADLDAILLQQAADLISTYQLFEPFCKTNSGSKSKRCMIQTVSWQSIGSEWRFTITADRFLRGMVRLIVGACVQYALGKLTLEDLRLALETQSPLRQAWSVPPQGLFLSQVQYPYIKVRNGVPIFPL